RRRLRQGGELLGLLAFAWAHGDVVTRYQGFQAGDASQADTRLDQPEARPGGQVRLRSLVHLDGGDNPGAVAFDIEHQALHLADRHALVDDFGLVGDDALAGEEADLDLHTGVTVGLPGQPATDHQSDQRQDPDGRPIRSWAGFSRRH